MTEQLAQILADLFCLDTTDFRAALLLCPTEEERKCVATLMDAGMDISYYEIEHPSNLTHNTDFKAWFLFHPSINDPLT